MKINETMQWVRNLRNLTRQEAAGAAGISDKYYQQLENGNKNPRPKALFKISEGLNIPMDLFFRDEDKRFLVNSIIALIYMTPDDVLDTQIESLILCKSMKNGGTGHEGR